MERELLEKKTIRLALIHYLNCEKSSKALENMIDQMIESLELDIQDLEYELKQLPY